MWRRPEQKKDDYGSIFLLVESPLWDEQPQAVVSLQKHLQQINDRSVITFFLQMRMFASASGK